MTRLRNLDDEVLEAPFDRKQFFRLLGYLKPYRKQMGISLLLMIIASGASLINPYLMSRAVGRLSAGDFTGVPWYFAGMTLAVLVAANVLGPLKRLARAPADLGRPFFRE